MHINTLEKVVKSLSVVLNNKIVLDSTVGVFWQCSWHC